MTQISVSGADNTALSTPSSATMLAKYQYESGVNNGRLSKLSYGNGQSVQYSYDKFDRTTKEQYNNVTYEYAYDAKGHLAKQTSTGGEEYNYEYDSLGRLIRSNEYNGGSLEQRTEHIYDAADRLTKQTWINSGGTTTLEYAYSTTTGLLTSLNANLVGTSIPVAYTYQGANQLRSKAIGSVMTKAYNFGTSSGYRTALPSFVNYRDPDGNLIYGDYCLYDGSGRIVSIADSGNTSSVRATYGYDEQGQLTLAAVGGTSYAYTYDTAGNLITKTDGGTSHSYTYGNGAWRDLLTAYDGKAIVYEGQSYNSTTGEVSGSAVSGNPKRYYNGKTWTMTWEQGRQLATAKRNTSTSTKTIAYDYDMAGVRSGKTVTTKNKSTGETTVVEYKYTTLSGLLTRMTYGTTAMDFVYDESNQPLAVKYTNLSTGSSAKYYYVVNAQGDVVGLTNSSGDLVIEYVYDPWGSLLETKIGVDESNSKYSVYNNMALRNPLRYRGYIYECDTGFYYLQSRYYDPATGRFINADSYASTDATGLLSTNMFAYCENDPVNRSDPSGEFFDTVLDIVSLCVSVAEVIDNPSDPWAWAGLTGDLIDLIPLVTGVGETIRAVNTARKAAKRADCVVDATKVAVKASDRTKAVRQAWKNERINVQAGENGVSRHWTALEKTKLLSTGKIKGYQGHHMKSVRGYPQLGSDPTNIQFLTRKEHLAAHGGNWKNITRGYFDYRIWSGPR